MRRKKFTFYNEVNAAMTNFYSCENKTVEEAVAILKPYRWMIEQLYQRQLDIEDDHRPGEETYGYEDEEAILDNLMYISDRWCAAFRLRWMLDLIRMNDELKQCGTCRYNGTASKVCLQCTRNVFDKWEARINEG